MVVFFIFSIVKSIICGLRSDVTGVGYRQQVVLVVEIMLMIIMITKYICISIFQIVVMGLKNDQTLLWSDCVSLAFISAGFPGGVSINIIICIITVVLNSVTL